MEVQIAADSLGLLGPGARDSVPALAIALTREFGESFGMATSHSERGASPPQDRPSGAIGDPGVDRGLDSGTTFGLTQAVSALWTCAMNRIAQARRPRPRCSAHSEPKPGCAVPALIEAVQRHEKADGNWTVRLKAIEALGRIGPDAKPAIPMLRDLMKAKQHDPQYLPVILAALYRLAPDGKGLVENWLDTAVKKRRTSWTREPLLGRAMLMGVTGRTSVEAEYLTRATLSSIDRMFASDDPEADDPPMPVAEWFEKLAEFGVGSRKALPVFVSSRNTQAHGSGCGRLKL